MDFLLKTEPSTYSFSDLLREKSTIWDGVANPVALRHLRDMKEGDRLIIYHTGEEKSAVGTAVVVSADPSNSQVRIKADSTLTKRVPLSEIKEHKIFADSPLVRQGRLSVVPLTKEQWNFLTGG